jgi:hypothetical protein
MLYSSQRSFVSLAGGVLVVLAGLFLTGRIDGFSAMPSQAARPSKEKEAIIFPHMDAALGLLKAADGQLEKGEPEFYGHRIAAIAHVKKAIADLQKGINDYMARHPEATRNEVVPAAPPGEAGDKYPRMQGALKLLQQAEVHLNEAAKQYSGERVAGLGETRAAIAEIQTGMKDATQHRR